MNRFDEIEIAANRKLSWECGKQLLGEKLRGIACVIQWIGIGRIQYLITGYERSYLSHVTSNFSLTGVIGLLLRAMRGVTSVILQVTFPLQELCG